MLTMMTNYTNHNYNSNNDDNISRTIIWRNFNPFFRCTGSFLFLFLGGDTGGGSGYSGFKIHDATGGRCAGGGVSVCETDKQHAKCIQTKRCGTTCRRWSSSPSVCVSTTTSKPKQHRCLTDHTCHRKRGRGQEGRGRKCRGRGGLWFSGISRCFAALCKDAEISCLHPIVTTRRLKGAGPAGWGGGIIKVKQCRRRFFRVRKKRATFTVGT